VIDRAAFLASFGDDPLVLPDVLALGSSEADWPLVLDAINSRDWPTPMPALVLPRNRIDAIPFEPVAGVLLNFYPGEDIMFVFDLRQMADQPAVDAVLSMVRLIGRTLQKPLLVIPEGAGESEAVARYGPADDEVVLVTALGGL
jgi:hypothetical protein